MKKCVGVHTTAEHALSAWQRSTGDCQRCRWGAVRLNHKGVAGLARLADQCVMGIWRVRSVIAVHKNLVCSWLRPGRTSGRKVAVARNWQLDPEPQFTSQSRQDR